ncbi:MAG: beta-class carbonic anhydrase [Acidimicrobiales bacterium]
MSEIDDLLTHNATYVARHGHRALDTSPRRRLAVLTCMDSRLDLFGALGLDLGEVHLIRNAGGQATEDAVRSLLLSQRLLGTRAIMVIHHTRCGLESFEEATLAADVERDAGERPPFRLGAYDDVDLDVQETVWALVGSPFVDSTEIRGFVFDVDEGSLREVPRASPAAS